jgi:hypothetical protein
VEVEGGQEHRRIEDRMIKEGFGIADREQQDFSIRERRGNRAPNEGWSVFAVEKWAGCDVAAVVEFWMSLVVPDPLNC